MENTLIVFFFHEHNFHPQVKKNCQEDFNEKTILVRHRERQINKIMVNKAAPYK